MVASERLPGAWRRAMTKALGDSGKPLIFTSGSAIFGVFTKGEAGPTIFDEDHPVPLPAPVFAPPEAEIPPPFRGRAI
jgi:hypothetical protein